MLPLARATLSKVSPSQARQRKQPRFSQVSSVSLAHATRPSVPLNPLTQPIRTTPSLHSTPSPRPSCNMHAVCQLPPSTHPSIPTPPPPAGLAVFQVIKAGFMFSGKAGSGLVIARLPDGSWSAPSCIATGGLGWGLQIGADITDFVIVLNSEDAVRAFSIGGNVTIGGNVSVAAGPIGTGGSVQASLAHPASMFSYSKSKGSSLLVCGVGC